MKKLVLIQPDLDPLYCDQHQAYGSSDRPSETGLAVLTAWVKQYSQTKPEVKVLNPSRSLNEIVAKAAQTDFVGISDWFTNHQNCLELAKAVKKINQTAKIIFGGPNAAMMGKLILQNHSFVDFVVGSPACRDGEEALVGIVDGLPPAQIPNLWYRRVEGEIKFSFLDFTNLTKIPLWDFDNFQDTKERLKKYLTCQKADPWQISPLSLFSCRGCLKAMREGRCSFCTSSEDNRCRLLSPIKFWQQVCHLNRQYAAETFYIGDDIFIISPQRIKKLAAAKPDEAKTNLRAYGYLPHLAALTEQELEEMARNLREIGVFNLFFGSEHFDLKILNLANKEQVETSRIIEIINRLHQAAGIKSCIAFLLGLPGESEKSLQNSLSSLRRLLRESSEAFERLYISIAIPLRGSRLFVQLVESQTAVEEYCRQTGKNLRDDDYPDYKLLVKLMLKNFTSITPAMLADYFNRMVGEARQHIPSYKIGGFMTEL